MMQIFKWFVGIVGIIILVYVLIIIFRSIFNIGSNAVVTLPTSTSTVQAVNSTGSNIGSWFSNFHPFTIAPIEVVPNTAGAIYKEINGEYYANTPATDRIFANSNNYPEDFDTRWSGRSNYYQNDTTTMIEKNNKKKINSNLILPNFNDNSIIKINQVISGNAYYKVFTNKTFPVYILDEDKNVIGLVKAYTNGTIKRDGYIPFRVVLDYERPTTNTGYLVFKNNNNLSDDAVTSVKIKFFSSSYRRYMTNIPDMLYASPGYRPINNLNNNYDYPLTNNLQNSCVISGCSMQLCVDQNDIGNTISSCEYRPSNTCYRTAICERNRETGRCGWRVDNTLAICLQRFP